MNEFKPPKYLFNGHAETILPYYIRKVSNPYYERERIDTPDGDFLDLDWKRTESRKLVVLTHGLESSSNAKYIVGMVNYFSEEGYDVLAWNCRSCSGEVNLKLEYYHCAVSHDLRAVLNHCFENTDYDEIYLVGFSMGGNITLKYLGEEGSKVNSKIKGAKAISTPLDLKTSAVEMGKGFNKLYTTSFLFGLRKKLLQKKDRLEAKGIYLSEFKKIKNFIDFDDYFTAQIHGFDGAYDYYEKGSGINYIEDIRVPTMILNAKNDPFLSKECYPGKESISNSNIEFSYPQYGGHVGFLAKNMTWSEPLTLNFIKSL
ncbi:MAG: YheT family hydrolase [Bacteriovoracaceae bacterium]